MCVLILVSCVCACVFVLSQSAFLVHMPLSKESKEGGKT